MLKPVAMGSGSEDCERCPEDKPHEAKFVITLSDKRGVVLQDESICPCCLYNEFRDVGLTQIEGGEEALLKMVYKECHGIVS